MDMKQKPPALKAETPKAQQTRGVETEKLDQRVTKEMLLILRRRGLLNGSEKTAADTGT